MFHDLVIRGSGQAHVASALDLEAERTRLRDRAPRQPLIDGAPYRLNLALVDGPVSDEKEWADAITWRSSDDFATAVLDGLLPRFAELLPQVQREADYIVPLAYAAFLLHDVLRAAGAADWPPVRGAIVIYNGGDSISVPMT